MKAQSAVLLTLAMLAIATFGTLVYVG